MSTESIVRCAVRAGAYYDSVVLMQLQRNLAALPGVVDAGVVMATPANREILAASGLLTAAAQGAEAGDLLIAVKAESDAIAGEALAQVDSLLQMRRSSSAKGAASESFRPRSLEGALKALPEARWVLVSLPGRYAAGVADEALERGRNVFLYSDNVRLADEVALKRKAAGRGLLVLGPDCGTAILGGIGLGFANRVRRGAIGLVAASGTGLQLVASLIHQGGGGISQAIGTGGRDLADEVDGTTARQALDLLARDPETRTIVLVSKPPSPAVGARLLAAARSAGKPVVVCFLGLTPPLRRLGNIHFAASLAHAAELALAAEAETKARTGAESFQVGRAALSSHPENNATAATGSPAAEHASPAISPHPESNLPAATTRSAEGHPATLGPGRFLRGLFSGGTLAYEVQLGLQAFLSPLWSNLKTASARPLADVHHSREHTILDLGADEFTVGRLHPMIDADLRLRRLRQEAADPGVGLVLLDLVLGDGAHADPAGELAPAIESARREATGDGRELAVVVLVLGTDLDPQGLDEQAATLERAGAWVCRTPEEMVEEVWNRIAPGEGQSYPPVPLEELASPLQAINLGLESFYDSLAAQGAPAVQVEWRPPAGGDERLAGILARLKHA
jgi:FdrA protein